MNQWATIDELFAFTGLPLPELDPAGQAELNALLRRASSRVDRMLRLTRAPSFRISAETFRNTQRDMTCAQTAYMQANGDDGTGVAMEWDSISLIGVQFSKAAKANADATAGRSGLDARYAPEAMEIAINAGMFSTRVASPGLRR